jgi:glyoxylase-like metal-dependent hydrolase (beta-lactamase superfamily II)
MRIAKGLEMLNLDVELHMPVTIHPTLVWDDNEIVLIDCTAPGQGKGLNEAITKAGIDSTQISRVLLTHHDADHVGDIGKIIQNGPPAIKVMSSAGEKPYIQGDLPPIKMTAERKAEMDEMLRKMPEAQRHEMQQAFDMTKAPVDEILTDSQLLPFCGGIRVIETPGHTPGHTSFYLQQYKILITGDALNVVDGVLRGPMAVHTYSMPRAIESLKKLLPYEIDAVICHHGGFYQGDIASQIRKIIAEQQ